ncbi:MAG: hypothetical protein H7Y07_01975 [Pyrinomonadaceae bacterium]|nr:hypothetical protein [Sphingobacteriaceae bacterium]
MAELHVQRKRKSSWWLWLIIILILAAVLYYLYINYYNTDNPLSGNQAINNLYHQLASLQFSSLKSSV